MPVVRKAQAEDFEKVFPLLLGLDAPQSMDSWRQLFVDHWGAGEGHFGYVLIDKERVVGFLGIISSNRYLRKRIQKICNITSWIVQPKYRNAGIQLLLPLLSIRNCTLTNLTPNRQVYKILTALGFKEFERSCRLIFPIPASRQFVKKCILTADRDIIGQQLDDDNLTIYNDHLSFKCIHQLLISNHGYCYMVISRTLKRGLPFANIHYISDFNLFVEYIERIRLYLCARLKAVALIIDERILKGKKIRFSAKFRLQAPRLYKSDILNADDIDGLYSELLVLNL